MPTKTYAYTIFVDWKGHVQVYTLESKACPYEVYQMLNDARKDGLFFYMDDHIFDPECIASVVLEAGTYDEEDISNMSLCVGEDPDSWIPFFNDNLEKEKEKTLQWLRTSHIIRASDMAEGIGTESIKSTMNDVVWYAIQFNCEKSLADFLKSKPRTLRNLMDDLLLADGFLNLCMRVNLNEIPIEVITTKAPSLYWGQNTLFIRVKEKR